MRLNFVPAVSIGALIPRDCLVVAEVSRGLGLDEMVGVTVDGETGVTISGAQLRAAVLWTVHPGPLRLGDIGAGRQAMRLDPGQVCSSVTHLDAGGAQRPMYWLYRRSTEGSVRLSRWIRAGHISQGGLLEQCGHEDVRSLSRATAQRAVVDLARNGLPATLTVVAAGPGSETRTVRAPEPGWLDIEPGALKRVERIPIHAVDDLGEWPGMVG